MRMEAPEQVDELPEDVAAAWATVLLDLWEKRQPHVQHYAEQTPAAPSATVKEDEVDGD